MQRVLSFAPILAILAVALPVSADSPTPADSESTPEGVRARRISKPDEPWSFETQRPIQAVLIGGSIAAYLRGGFGDLLTAACPDLELVNLAKTSLGTRGARDLFRTAVIENEGLGEPPPGTERWLIFQGGVNSSATPGLAIRHLRRLFAAAHGHGWKVYALSVTPWGSARNKYWRGLKGLRMKRGLQQMADFVVTGGRKPPRKRERPDRAMDLLDSALRDSEAEPLPLDALERSLRHSKRWQRKLGRGPKRKRKERRAQLLQEAAEVPRWWLRPELHSFDSTHPNADGHRIIAQLACPQMPPAASCDCDRIADLRWSTAAKGILRPQGTTAASEGKATKEAPAGGSSAEATPATKQREARTAPAKAAPPAGSAAP